jgi:antitoxin component HigA of HigAB toxin-antitoxin module
VLKTLKEDRGLKQVDLAPLFGGRSRVSDALAGKREIGKLRRRRSPHSLKRRRICSFDN